MKRALVFMLALLVTPALPGVAVAHVDVSPTEAPAGKAVKMSFSVGHGCDGAATTSLVVQVPDQVGDFTAESVPGWKAANTPGQMTWRGGPLPDNELQEFPFTATLYGKKGTATPFNVIQRCEGGGENAWIQPIPASGAEPEYPAPVVTLTSTATEPEPIVQPEASPHKGDEGDSLPVASEDTSDEDDGGSGAILPIIGVVLIAASVTAFVVIQRGKRRT